MSSNKIRKVPLWVASSFDEDDVQNIEEKKISRKRSRKDTSFKKRHTYAIANDGKSLWLDVCQPMDQDELAVNKKKVLEVEHCLKQCLTSRKSQIVLMTGPSGSGKTTTLRILAKELNAGITEWINPTVSRFVQKNEMLQGFTSELQYTSQCNLFKEFLFRTLKYSTVCSHHNSYSIVLVEDLPPYFYRNHLEFHDILRRLVQCNGGVVFFIISDTAQHENVVKQLFPQQIQTQLNIHHLAFNGIANTFMLKALQRVQSLMRYTTLQESHLLQSVVMAANGDIRSAINALQFKIYQDSYDMVDLFESKFFGAGKGKGNTVGIANRNKRKKTKPDDNNVNIPCKDNSLLLFRALGKVLYAKRETARNDPSSPTPSLPSLPPHLKQHERHPLLENPEDVFSRTPMDDSNFCLFLHHNCLSFMSCVQQSRRVFDDMAWADIIGTCWTPENTLSPYVSSISSRCVMHVIGVDNNRKSQFRPITKPQWYANLLSANQKAAQLRREYGHWNCSRKELTANVIPLLAKIGRFKDNYTGQLCNDIGLFKSQGFKKRFDKDEEDLIVEDDFEDKLLYVNQDTMSECNKDDIKLDYQRLDAENEENFVIEEYED